MPKVISFCMKGLILTVSEVSMSKNQRDSKVTEYAWAQPVASGAQDHPDVLDCAVSTHNCYASLQRAHGLSNVRTTAQELLHQMRREGSNRLCSAGY